MSIVLQTPTSPVLTARSRSRSRSRGHSISYSSTSRPRSLSNLTLTSPRFRPSLELFPEAEKLLSVSLITIPPELFHLVALNLHPIGTLEEVDDGRVEDFWQSRKNLLNLGKTHRVFYEWCRPLLFHTVDLRYTSVYKIESFVTFGLYGNSHLIKNVLFDFSSLNLNPQDNPAFKRLSSLNHILRLSERLQGLYLHFGGLDNRNKWMNDPTVIAMFDQLILTCSTPSYQLSELQIFGSAPRPYPAALQVLNTLLTQHQNHLRSLTADRWTDSSSSVSTLLSTSSIHSLHLKGTFKPFRLLPSTLSSLRISHPVGLDFFADVYPLLSSVSASLRSFSWIGHSMLPEGFETRNTDDEMLVQPQPVEFMALEKLEFHPDSQSQQATQFYEDELESLFFSIFSSPLTPLTEISYSRNSHNSFVRTLQPLWNFVKGKNVSELQKVRIGRNQEWNFVDREEWERFESWSRKEKITVVWNARHE